MTIKTLLYLIAIPFSFFVLDSININNIFKKNKITQAKLFYLTLVLIMSYLVVNFIYDFFLVTKIF